MRIAFIILLFVLLPKSRDATAAPENHEIPDKHSIKYLRDLNEALWDELNLNVLQGEDGEDTRLEPANDFSKFPGEEITGLSPKLILPPEFWDEVQKDSQLFIVAPLELIIQGIIIANEIERRLLLNTLAHCHCYTYTEENNIITPKSNMVSIPTHWLQYPEIVGRLLSGHVAINEVVFLRDYPEYYYEQDEPNTIAWNNIVFDDSSFAESSIKKMIFKRCHFENNDFRGAKLHRCRFEDCEFKNITVDKKTQIQTSDISKCSVAERNYLAELVGRPEEQDDLVFQLLTLLFLSQEFRDQSERYEYADDLVSIDYIQQFLGNYRELAEKHPQWIYVALQVLYAAARHKHKRMKGLAALSELMQEQSSNTLETIRKLETDENYWSKVKESIDWSHSELASDQLLYQYRIRHFLASNHMKAKDVPHDNFCLYHVLLTNGLGSSLADIRTRIITFMMTYLQYRNAMDTSEDTSSLTTENISEYRERFSYMDYLLDSDSNSPITLEMAEQLLSSVDDFGEWLDVSSLPLLAIIFGRPILQVVPSGSTVDAGYIYSNGQVESNWREAVAQTTQPPVVVIHNGENHWFTATFLFALTHSYWLSVNRER